MQTSVHINFNGQCETALKFYQENLGGTIEFLMLHEASPMANQVPPEWGKKVLHARLSLGGQIILACDAPPNCYQPAAGYSLSLGIKDPAEADRLFQVLSHDGRVTMPIQETFWAQRFGMLVDRFGIPWMINCEKAFQGVPETEELHAVA
jgi:PhnB protein